MSSNLVVNHQHCYICGRATTFDPDKKYCSPECKAKLDEQHKKRRQLMLMMIGFAAVAMFLSIWGSIPR